MAAQSSSRWRASIAALWLLGVACGHASPGPLIPSEEPGCIVIDRSCPFVQGRSDGIECDDASDCPGGDQVCQDLTVLSAWRVSCLVAAVCQVPCDCSPDDVCAPDGTCGPPRCDEPDAGACPAHYRCDPVAALTENVGAYPTGSSVTLAEDFLRASAAGCVRRLCDDPDGFVCDPRYTCAPEPPDAPDAPESPVGCLPRPCSETGLCASTAYTCTSESTHTRGVLVDAFGCVEKNCEDDGFLCTGAVDSGGALGDIFLPRSCDFSRPDAGIDGCVALPCDAPGSGCPGSLTCDPGSAAPKTSTGCRYSRCPTEYACTGSRHCEPAAMNSDQNGCAPGVETIGETTHGACQ